jgi:hypothetical protein
VKEIHVAPLSETLMLTLFFTVKGIVPEHCVSRNQIVNGEYYALHPECSMGKGDLNSCQE